MLPTEAVILSCKEIASAGYELALDDFIYDLALEPLIAMAGIRRFIPIILMSVFAENKPHELIRVSAIRARFCELLCENTKMRLRSSELFTIGSVDIRNVLVSNSGEMADILNLVRAYETGDWEAVSQSAKIIGMDNDRGFPGCTGMPCYGRTHRQPLLSGTFLKDDFNPLFGERRDSAAISLRYFLLTSPGPMPPVPRTNGSVRQTSPGGFAFPFRGPDL